VFVCVSSIFDFTLTCDTELQTHSGAARTPLTSGPPGLLQRPINHHDAVLHGKDHTCQMVSKSRKVFAPDLHIRDQFSISLIDSSEHKPENSGNARARSSKQNLKVTQRTPSGKTAQENHQSRIRPALDKVAALASDSPNHDGQNSIIDQLAGVQVQHVGQDDAKLCLVESKLFLELDFVKGVHADERSRLDRTSTRQSKQPPNQQNPAPHPIHTGLKSTSVPTTASNKSCTLTPESVSASMTVLQDRCCAMRNNLRHFLVLSMRFSTRVCCTAVSCLRGAQMRGVSR
jgi:hypothetical protein